MVAPIESRSTGPFRNAPQHIATRVREEAEGEFFGSSDYTNARRNWCVGSNGLGVNPQGRHGDRASSFGWSSITSFGSSEGV